MLFFCLLIVGNIQMRGNMDPLKPAFATLTPAIAQITQSARTLSGNSDMDASYDSRDEQRRAVQYVLDAPTRLEELANQGRDSEAIDDWAKVSKLLAKWKGVPGVADVQQQCDAIMRDVGKT